MTQPYDETDPARPARPQRPVIWWVLGLAFAMIVTAFISWRILGVSDEKITVRETGYQVVDDRTTTISFIVGRRPGQPVTCTVQAQDLRKNAVGSAEVVVPPTAEREAAASATIRTTTRAFAAIVYSCVRT